MPEKECISWKIDNFVGILLIIKAVRRLLCQQLFTYPLLLVKIEIIIKKNL
jgi:hypothetical protein